MTETTQTQTEVVKETVVVSEPVESVAVADSSVSSDAEQGDTSIEVTDGETSLAVSADDPVTLSVAVALGLLVVVAFAVKKLLNK